MYGLSMTAGMMTTKQSNGCTSSVSPADKQWKFIQMEQAKEIMEEELKKKMAKKNGCGIATSNLAASLPGVSNKIDNTSESSTLSGSKRKESEGSTHSLGGKLMFLNHPCGKCNRNILYARGVTTIKCPSCGTQCVPNADDKTEPQDSKKQKLDAKLVTSPLTGLLPVQRKPSRTHEKVTC